MLIQLPSCVMVRHGSACGVSGGIYGFRQEQRRAGTCPAAGLGFCGPGCPYRVSRAANRSRDFSGPKRARVSARRNQRAARSADRVARTRQRGRARRRGVRTGKEPRIVTAVANGFPGSARIRTLATEPDGWHRTAAAGRSRPVRSTVCGTPSLLSPGEPWW